MIDKIAGRIAITLLVCVLFVACTPKAKSNFEIAPVDFLDKKYQENGFVLPDTSKTVRTYPSYLSSDDLGVFTVIILERQGMNSFFGKQIICLVFSLRKIKLQLENLK